MMYNVSIRIKDVDVCAKISSREVVLSVFFHCGSCCMSMCCVGLCECDVEHISLFGISQAVVPKNVLV